MERQFEKDIPGTGKITVTIGTPSLDEYNQVRLPYKLLGAVEDANKFNAEGCYFGEYATDTLKICTSKIKIKGKKVGGLRLPPELAAEINAEVAGLLAERKQIFDDTVRELVEGSRPINFGLVGCDYVHYQAWLRPCPIPGQEQNIMEKAARQIITAEGLDPSRDFNVGNICDFLGKPHPTKELPSLGFDPEHDEKSMSYHGFVPEIITGYNVRLADLLNPKIAKAKAKKEAKADHRAAKIAEAKLAGKPVVLYFWNEECNDRNEECSLDNVHVLIDANGKETTNRVHTY